MILQTKGQDNKKNYELSVDFVEDAFCKRSLKISMTTEYGTTGMYICEASAKLLAEELNRFVKLISESPKEAIQCDDEFESVQADDERKKSSDSLWKWNKQ